MLESVFMGFRVYLSDKTGVRGYSSVVKQVPNFFLLGQSPESQPGH